MIDMSCGSAIRDFLSSKSSRVSKRTLYAALAAMIAEVFLHAPIAKAEQGAASPARSGEVVAKVHAEGVQVYECKMGTNSLLSWQFREPLATLIEGEQTVGRHFVGPSWEFEDGTSIKGKVVSQSPGATSEDIPDLELDVIEHHGNGALAKATIVERLETRGGIYVGSCDHAGAFHVEPYTATYVFIAR